jgi:hypothetical protein
MHLNMRHFSFDLISTIRLENNRKKNYGRVKEIEREETLLLIINSDCKRERKKLNIFLYKKRRRRKKQK